MILKRITTANMNDTAESSVPFIRSVRWTGCADPDSAAEKIRSAKGRRRKGRGSVPAIIGTIDRHISVWIPEWCAALDRTVSGDRRPAGYTGYNGGDACDRMEMDRAFADGGIDSSKPARITGKCMLCALNRVYNLSMMNFLRHYTSLYVIEQRSYPGDLGEYWPEFMDDCPRAAPVWRRGKPA